MARKKSEKWRDIEGYFGDYQVSNFGRVKSIKTWEDRILKPQTDRDGYLQVGLSRDGNQKTCKIHRLVAKAFVPNPDGKPQINHINGIKSDNRVENLEWATASENMRHAVDTGLKHTKLTNEQIEWIRNNYKPNDREYGTSALARKFKVAPNTISYIVRGETYANADGAIAERVEKRKFTDEQVRFIRDNYIKGDSDFGGKALARRFGVNPQTISNIINGKIYRDVH